MIWPYPESVTLHRVSIDGVDEYGNDVLVDVTQTVDGCALWPSDANASGSNEDTQARDLVLSGYTVLMPTGTTVTPYDRVTLPDGLLYEVVGTPGRWRSPLTATDPGVQVMLQRVAG